jgi:hypothetical protein
MRKSCVCENLDKISRLRKSILRKSCENLAKILRQSCEILRESRENLASCEIKRREAKNRKPDPLFPHPLFISLLSHSSHLLPIPHLLLPPIFTLVKLSLGHSHIRTLQQNSPANHVNLCTFLLLCTAHTQLPSYKNQKREYYFSALF